MIFVNLTEFSITESPIEEVTDAMYGKWRSFMMTHNLKMKLPEMVFDGATFQVTPRGFDGDGVLVKLEMIPKALEEPQPRILFKKISKKLNKISKCTAQFQNSWLVDLSWYSCCNSIHSTTNAQ